MTISVSALLLLVAVVCFGAAAFFHWERGVGIGLFFLALALLVESVHVGG